MCCVCGLCVCVCVCVCVWIVCMCVCVCVCVCITRFVCTQLYFFIHPRQRQHYDYSTWMYMYQAYYFIMQYYLSLFRCCFSFQLYWSCCCVLKPYSASLYGWRMCLYPVFRTYVIPPTCPQPPSKVVFLVG